MPTKQSIVASSIGAVKWANSNFNGQLIVWGRSFGSAVAAQVINKLKNEIDGFILTSPMSSIENVILHHIKELYSLLPQAWLEKNEFNSLVALNKVKLPALVFHGDDDDTIPYFMGLDLFNLIKKSNKNAKFVTLKKADHNNVFEYEEMWKISQDFINKNFL